MNHETIPTALGRSRITPTIRALYRTAAQAYTDLTQRALPTQLLLHHDALLSELVTAFGASARFTSSLTQAHQGFAPDIPVYDTILSSDDDTVYSDFSFDDRSTTSDQSDVTQYSFFARADLVPSDSSDTDEYFDDPEDDISEAFTLADIGLLPEDDSWSQRCRVRRTNHAAWACPSFQVQSSESDWRETVLGAERNESYKCAEMLKNYFEMAGGSAPQIAPVRLARLFECLTGSAYAPKSLTGKYVTLLPAQDDIAATLETVLLTGYFMHKAKTFPERLIVIANHARLLNTPCNQTQLVIAALQSAYEYFSQPKEGEVLETQGYEADFDTLQDFLDRYDTIKSSPLFAKTYKFSCYALALSLFAPLGITFNLLRFDKVAEEAMRRKYHMGPDFIHSLLDTALFLTRRGYQCYQTGSIAPLFHSAEKYQQWYDQAELLIRQSHFLSNPEVHGIDRFKYLADLKHAIECGRSMKKCATKREDRLLISKLLSSLELTHDLELTKRAAQMDRKTPLCLLLYGGSGIGKSTIQNILFQHYGKVRGLSTLSEYRYIRNPTEAFWSGMNSTQWCIVLDDIAFLSARLGVLDPSLAEMLCIANNVPFVPAQADICDKGRTPVRAELVIGSTNTEDMNLHAYFSCPLAVQRRFPWIIDVRVKPCYQDANRPGMLDSSKVPVTPAGEYPDLWTFVIKRVEPVGEERHHQMGRTVTDKEINTMPEFLRWYNEVIDQHNTVQDKIMASNARTYDTALCPACKLPITWCECLPTQSLENDLFGEAEMSTPEYIQNMHRTSIRDDVVASTRDASFSGQLAFVWHYAVFRFVYSTWLNTPVTWALGPHWYMKSIANSSHKWELTKIAVRFAGARASRRLGTDNQRLIATATAIMGVLALYKLHGHLARDMFAQGAVLGRPPLADGEPSLQPSYADPFPFHRDDLSQQSLCTRGSDGKVLKDNVRFATSYITTNDGDKLRSTLAINIRGGVYMCNAHSIPTKVPFNLDIITDSTHKGLRRAVKDVLVTGSMVRIVPDKDLAFIHLRMLPPGTDLIPWMAKPSFTGKLDGLYIGREASGELWERTVVNIQPCTATWLSHGAPVTGDMWKGTVDRPTIVGNCGALLIANTGAGWTLLGMHTLGGGNEVRVLRVDPATMEQACDFFEPRPVARGALHVSAPSAERVVVELEPQSVVAKMSGTANVLGSFRGDFRTRGRTMVTETVLAPYLKTELGFEQTRTRPDMGRLPWSNALRDMVRPVVRLDNDVLMRARDMFIEETTTQDVSRVHVYDLPTAINGMPGLAFCDKLPRKTSAGAPYKCSKAKFMYFISEDTTDMDVTQEIKDTMSDIVSSYQRGERYHAVFCGQLKDEPVTFAKAAAGKTRVFTMAGLAHTLVTRQYLLSVVVYLQQRRFQYEMGVGISAQSREWDQAYHYLTRFGTTRMVAGDYAKFDKRMPASAILAAFDILLDICQRAGYADDELAVVRGIAYDTAFPTVDYCGELVEFYGSNPSGHALTVVINSLVNSIYMRYAYLALRPVACTARFKLMVSLFTYGDDNAMGVSELAPWFNHTTIQAVLASVDIEYTMAEKEAQSVPYISIEEVSFLKRTWRWDEELQVFVGPLARESMEKMLMVCVQKANISMNCHAIQVIGTAVREFFFHGRPTFEQMTRSLKKVVGQANLDAYVEPSTFPSWEELCKDFHARSVFVKELSFK